MFKKQLFVLAALMLVAACQQMPQRQPPIELNKIIKAEGSLIAEQAALKSKSFADVAGTVCVPNDQGVCESKRFAPNTYLGAGAKPKLTLEPASAKPLHHSLYDNQYKFDAGIPFLNATRSSENLDEVEVRHVAFATLEGNSPTAQELYTTLLRDGAISKNEKFVYWVRGAALLSVMKRAFVKVSSAGSVAGIGFGLSGNTYSSGEEAEFQLYIDYDFHQINFDFEADGNLKASMAKKLTEFPRVYFVYDSKSESFTPLKGK